MLTALLFYGSYSYGIKFVNNQYIPADYVVIASQIRSDVAAKLSEHHVRGQT